MVTRGKKVMQLMTLTFSTGSSPPVLRESTHAVRVNCILLSSRRNLRSYIGEVAKLRDADVSRC